MNLRTEINIVKIIAAIITTIAVMCACRAFGNDSDKISKLYKHYNKTLTQAQVTAMTNATIKAGEKYKVSPALIASIIVTESSARPSVISKGGDYGLMQVRYRVHKDKVKSAKDLLTINTNIMIGTRIFAQYYKQKKTVYGALVRYSGGNKYMARKVLKTLNGLHKVCINE